MEHISNSQYGYGLRQCFRDERFRSSKLPHFICRNTVVNFRKIVSLLNATPAIWGAAPPWERSGAPAIIPDSTSTFSFRIWALEVNHAAVDEYVQLGKSTSQFSMILDSSLDDTAILKLAGVCNNLSDYDSGIELTVDCISILRWAYIPMWEENDVALVVFSPFLETVAQKIIDVFHGGNEQIWTLRQS